MATHSSTLSWKIPWTEEPGGLQSMRSQKFPLGYSKSLSRSGSEQYHNIMYTHIPKFWNFIFLNSMDLTEAEDIKKRWQEYTEELY